MMAGLRTPALAVLLCLHWHHVLTGTLFVVPGDDVFFNISITSVRPTDGFITLESSKDQIHKIMIFMDGIDPPFISALYRGRINFTGNIGQLEMNFWLYNVSIEDAGEFLVAPVGIKKVFGSQILAVAGLTCDTGVPPLWESPKTRCMFYFNWNCSGREGETYLLKLWKKDNEDIAFCRRNSNFTTTDDYRGRLEQYNENGFIFRDVKSKDAGYYTFVITINNTNEVILSSHIYFPSIPSCDPNRTVIYKDTITNGFPCDGGQIPIFIGLLSAFGIIIMLLIVLIIYLCCRMSNRLSKNDTRKSHHDGGGDIKLISRTS